MIEECIAQAEAQEGKAGELSDECKAAIIHDFASSTVDACNKPHGPNADAIYRGTAQTAETMLDYLDRKGYLKPSQAIGEQTPVAWMNGPEEKEGCITAQRKSLWESNGNELFAQQYTIPLYRSPLSPEARDRAIEALESARKMLVLTKIVHKSVECGKSADLCDQALSALRGQPSGA